MNGFAPERAPLSDTLRADIAAELSSRKPRATFNLDARARFLEGVSAAVALYRLTASQPPKDRNLRAGQIERLTGAANDLAKAFRSLDPDDAEVFADLLEHRANARLGGGSLGTFFESLASCASELATAHRRTRGEHDVVDGAIKLLVSQLATAWQNCFMRPATAGGAFADVVAHVMQDMDRPPLGRAALQSILDHRG